VNKIYKRIWKNFGEKRENQLEIAVIVDETLHLKGKYSIITSLLGTGKTVPVQEKPWDILFPQYDIPLKLTSLLLYLLPLRVYRIRYSMTYISSGNISNQR